MNEPADTPKFVILGQPMGGTLAAAEAAGAIAASPHISKLAQKIITLHSLPVSKTIIELPFTGLWDSKLFDTSRVSQDDTVYFLFYEGTAFSYSRNYLKHLRKKYKHCRLIHLFRNPMSGVHIPILKKWQTVRDYYDLSVTLVMADAERLGIAFCDYWPCLLPDKDFQPENASDVFFVAQAKDRLPMILDVYERLADAGLKCSFYVAGIPESGQKYADVIHYNHWISYDEVLQHVRNTKCVLEILPFGQHYSSLRVCEALWYRKKLLTTNMEAPREWFYHPEIVQCFRKAQDIDTEFITKTLDSETESRIFGRMNVGDFQVFASRLIDLVNKVC